jgi:predicted RNase H-like nuclease
MSNKKKVVRLTESELVDLIEKITKTAKKESLRESKRLETRRRVMAEANKPRRKSNRLTERRRK